MIAIHKAAELVARIAKTDWPMAKKLYAAARVYIAAGFYVLPCDALKRPIFKNGVCDATRELAVLRKAFLTGRATTIGVACGKLASGEAMMVLDLDVPKKHSPGPTGMEWYKDLSDDARAGLTEGIRVVTPGPDKGARGQGVHLWLMTPEGVEIANRASKLAPHVDTRGGGGYAIAPPSVSAEGGYRFASTKSARHAPQWLLTNPAVLKGPAPERALRDGDEVKTKTAASSVSTFPAGPVDRERIEAMAKTPEGQRHDTLLRSAAAMAAHGASDDTLRELGAAAIAAGLPDSETQRTLADGANWGRNQLAAKVHAAPSLPPKFLSPAFDPAWLPPVISEYVAEQANALAACPGAVALAVLALIASLIARAISTIIVGPSWQERPNLWSLNIAPSGSRKTPILRAALAGIDVLEDAMDDQNRARKLEYEDALEQYKVELAEARKAKSEKPKNPELPPMIRFRTDDFTPEALKILVGDNKSILLDLDDVGGVLEKASTSEGASLRRALLNGADGKKSYTDRITRDAPPARGFLTIYGNVQPEVIRAFVARARGKHDDGLLQRFSLLCVSEASAPRLAPLLQHSDRYKVLCEKIFAASNVTGPASLSRPAAERFVAWAKDNHRCIQEHADFPAYASWRSKLGSCVAALALMDWTIRRLLGETVGATIGVDAIERALPIVQWSDAAARWMFGLHNELSVEARRLQQAFERFDVRSATPRDVTRRAMGGLRRAEDARRILNELADAGFVEEISRDRFVVAPRPSKPH